MDGTSRARAWLILLALAGGVLIFQLVERSKGWTARSRAELLGKELLDAQTPEQAKAIARELGALDEAAVPTLVRALVSEEPFVSAAAGEEISRRLAAWRQLPRKTSGTKVQLLAKELAQERESIPPEHQRTARRWAEAILLWPLKGSQADAAAILADCEALLELPQPDEELIAERLARLKEPAKDPGQENPLEVQLPAEVVTPDDTANLPPIVSPEDIRPPATNSGSVGDTDSPDPTQLPRHPREPRGIYVPRARPIEDAAPLSEPMILPAEEPRLLPPVKASAAAAVELRALPEIEVMRDLHSDDPATVAAAERELTRRGYRASHVSLARQLTDPDPAVRVQLVQSLPRAHGIAPRRWLLRLSEDPDEEVRSAAQSILRTSQDPELLQKVR